MTKKLKRILAKKSGRNSQGKVTVRHQGGRQKQYLREIDFKRDKTEITARVIAISYDPVRTADVALLSYQDGEKRYIIAPRDLKIGDMIVSGPKAEIKAGNCLPLKKIPVGTTVHNLELTPGKGGQLARGAGVGAIIQSREKNWVVVKLPSGEQRKIHSDCRATIGQIGREEIKTTPIGKAGRNRLKGIRPGVRGVAQHPDSHPHGGGEGRSGIGMPSPKSPWGKRTLGKKTRSKKKYSNRWIIKRK